MSVLEFVSTPPGNMLQILCLQLKGLSQGVPHRLSVQGPDPNARDLFPRPDVLGKLWNHQALV